MVYLVPAGCDEGAAAQFAFGGLRGTGKQPLVESEEVGIRKPESTLRAVRHLVLKCLESSLSKFVGMAIQVHFPRTTVKTTPSSRRLL